MRHISECVSEVLAELERMRLEDQAARDAIHAAKGGDSSTDREESS